MIATQTAVPGSLQLDLARTIQDLSVSAWGERQATVLVVDDSAVTRTLEKGILEAAGYQVRVAPDGAAALELLRREPCDLVVTDVEMPRLDGFALTAEVRSDDRLRDLPVVLVTSLASEDDRRRGVEAGADAYIVKGAFDQDRLLETIRRLI